MLKLHEDRTSIQTLILMILIAYLFSVSLRFLWVHEFSSLAQFHWNNELMINTNDGYLFAADAKDVLNNNINAKSISPIEAPMAELTALLSKIFPVSFETLILYMPAFIGSLIIIPLILIGRAFQQTTMGFIAALLGSIANSYYNRTMSGYYDTDMLNIVFPVFEMFSLILALTHQHNRFLLPITLSIGLYQWWYPQAYALDSALFAIILVYTILVNRKNIFFYKIALFILIGILSLPLTLKIVLASVVFVFFHFQEQLSQKFFWPIFITFMGAYFYTGGFDYIWTLLKLYIFHNTSENTTISSSLHYYNVIDTVREAGHIPFTVFAERISGHTITFILSCIGYIMAIIAYRPLLITLPLVGLGFIAISSGLRFTIYAVPMMAIGFAYLLLWLTQRIEKPWLRYVSVIFFTVTALYPNYAHIKEYMTPTVLTNQEVTSLEQLHKIAQREDYVVAWWDYGYPIRYYSDVKTWIDGGKHTGDVNFPASYVLTTQDPLSAAHMLRLFTEYTENGYSDTNKTQNDFEYMMSKEGFKDPEEFLTALSLPEYKLPKKTRNIYLYLPLRMMEILPTVTLFSNLDLKNPNVHQQQPFFYSTQTIQDTGKIVDLGSGLSIIKDKNIIKLGTQEVPIKSFYQVSYSSNKILQVNEQKFASEGLNLIYMPSYGRFLVVDDFYLNSTYIQMFVFERYDKNLFEPVILDPMSKIFKLKL
ncbi:MAG: STT3 domain-containing protein [Sulfuricurvum sp.]|nr:STT3 domain-containing protein [Sulfuricurvum sp.]